jgi:hypothetical protein
VREKSHIDDMRSAIRGDFERLAERRGGQELMRPASEQADEPADTTAPREEPEVFEASIVEEVLTNGTEESESMLEADQASLVPIRHEEEDASAEPVSAELVTIRHEVAVDDEGEPPPADHTPAVDETQVHDELPADEAPRRSWLDRLLGR